MYKNEIYDKINQFKENTKNKLIGLKENHKNLIKIFIILVVIFGIAFYPLIRANLNYQDDQGRVMLGYKEWSNFSRYTSYYLSSFIHTSDYLTDISPLTQIIAIVFLAISGIIILHLFKKGKKINFLNIFAVALLGLCPYFLSCLSYKFDAPYMALSILASIVPFIFYKQKGRKKWIFSIAVFIGTLVMCTTYQAASGIIPIMAIFLALQLWNNKENKEAILTLVITAVSYLVGIIIFKLFIMVPTLQELMFPLDKLIPGFLDNLKKLYDSIFSDFRSIWVLLISILVLCFIINNIRNSKQNKILSAVVTIVALILVGVLSFGFYPALEYVSNEPRAMYGIGITISLIAVNATMFEKTYISKIISIVLCWCFITFACTYGNALSEQKQYIDFRVQSVINSLNEMDVMLTDDIKQVRITGNAGYAPSIENMPTKYSNLITRISSQTFSGIWTWNQYYFDKYFKIKNIKLNNDNTEIPTDLEVAKDTMYFRISTNNKDYILIDIK